MDELIIKRAQKDDKESFAKAILQLKDQAYRVAYCYLHNEEDSMDAVCDAVEKAYVNIKKLQNPEFFKTWFIRIVINECKSQLRARQKAINIDEQMDLVEAPEINKEAKVDLESILIKLNPLDRLLIYMKYYLGYTLEEIAEAMDMPAGTVKSKIYSNLKKMKSSLEVRGV